jgi:hypothetical protein
MRIASRSGMIVTPLAIAAIAAPNAQAGLFSNDSDPKGADRHEAQSFPRIYGASDSNPPPDATPTSGTTSDGFDYGDAAVGAGIAGGLVLLTVPGGLTVRRRTQLQHP